MRSAAGFLVVVCALAAGAGCPSQPLRCPNGDGLGTWRPVTTENAPSQRIGHAMAGVGDGFIVWGGRSEAGLAGDGARFLERQNAWVPLNPGGAPSPREHFAWAYAGNRLLIAGGHDGSVLGDVFLYDVPGDRWTRVSTAGGLTPRYLAAAVGTALGGGVRFYVLGGRNETGPLNDLWALDVLDNAAPQWTLVSEACPLMQPRDDVPQRMRPLGLFIEPATFLPMAFSGLGVDGTQARAAIFNLGDGTWILDEPENAPAPREGAAVLHDGRWLIVTGGVVPGREPSDDVTDFLGDGAYLRLVIPDDGGVRPRWVWERFVDGRGVTVPRAFHAAVSTGEAVLVTGGNDPGYCGGGARWDVTGTWDRLAVSGAPGNLPLLGGVWLTPSLDGDGGVQGGGFYVFGGHRPAALGGTAPLVVRWTP